MRVQATKQVNYPGHERRKAQKAARNQSGCYIGGIL
nr:MAG TPA: hypothetical protein [Caudoviricetes sp.]DAW26188.1 MAG TPA: hypothetical protein [Caudoviricetes sp.]DAX32288.1 MAG TPA: hypothetical protein [Caudoviricetes sp.]